MAIRSVSRIIEPQLVIEGAGVLLRRSIAPRVSNEYDPFLLFDHFAFNDPAEGPIRGFPTHPHRGIETVTYMLEGSVQHRDSLGNAGLIGPGDVQWMTAGGGILHEEMPRRNEQGHNYGFQLWVNLPARLKMSAPRYQEVKAENIPSVERNGVRLRVVAGEAFGLRGPVTEIAAGPLYMEIALAPNARFEQTLPEEHTAFAYVFEGEARFGALEQPVPAVRMAVLSNGTVIAARGGPQGARMLLAAGGPFRETIVPYGPFVMNTEAEIRQALQDLREGTFVK